METSRWSYVEIELTSEERAAWARRREVERLAKLSLADRIREADERAAQGPWLAAAGGTEKPFQTRSGHRVLYCWQPSTGRHAYLDCGSDTVISPDALAAYGLG